MIPSLGNVKSAVRSVLNDLDMAGGQIATDANQQAFFAAAYRELYRVLELVENPKTVRSAYFNVPPLTSYAIPAGMGINNLGEPDRLSERAIQLTGNVTGAAVIASPPAVQLTIPAHPFSSGQTVQVYGIVGLSDDVNDDFTITVIDANTISLNGAQPTGAWASGGVVTYSGEDWVDLDDADAIIFNYPNVPGAALLQYVWLNDHFRWLPSTTTRQLRIYYLISGNPPTDNAVSIGIDDSLDYLSYRTAGLLARAKGFTMAAEACDSLAVGPSGQADGTGGFLGQMTSLGIRRMQSVRVIPRRWRIKRNQGPLIYQW